MKNISIRFIEYRINNKVTNYTLQRKGFLGNWIDYKYKQSLKHSSIQLDCLYQNRDKKELITQVVHEVYQTEFQDIQFREYPDVIIHQFTDDYRYGVRSN